MKVLLIHGLSTEIAALHLYILILFSNNLQKGSKEKYLSYAATQNWIVKFDDVVEDLDTGISSVAVDNNGGQAVIYDLNGRQMPTIDSSRKGIYIVNGKKMIR